MVRHKKKKNEIPNWLLAFIILFIIISYAAGFYEAKEIYQKYRLPNLEDCLQACNILRRNNYVIYHSYTKALNQRQDYYIECSGHNLINITPLGSPIFLDNFTGGLCL